MEVRMLTATPKHWYSWEFTLAAGDRVVADIDISSWRERGGLQINGRSYRVHRDGMMGPFIVDADGVEIARAEKPSAFYRAFVVRHDGRELELRAAHALRRQFVVLDGDTEVGAIDPQSLWTRSANVNFRIPLPDAVQAFIVWLTLLLWKREADGGAAAGSA
jgi:hypothetical protein